MLGAYGEAVPDVRLERWPLTLQGVPVGELVAAPRRGEDAFDERGRRILGDLAHHIGPAVRADSLTSDLVLARQHLVTAREEERRRLRRDLHDGLGPLLTALGLNLDAAEAQLSRDPARANELLHSAKQVSTQVIQDLRELVHGLRPPTLDDLGLLGALRLQTERLSRDSGLALTVHADDLMPLPAAVEVAAYRTVVEAVTNVVRHGSARRCHVELGVEPGSFTVTVSDDGPGRGPWSVGVGIAAMGERATELGGTLSAGPTATGGRVSATYPLTGTVADAVVVAPSVAVAEGGPP